MPVLISNQGGKDPLFALDTKSPVRINPWEFFLKGWFISTPSWQEVQTLGVIIDGDLTPAVYGLSRPDVGRHLNSRRLENCGFYVRFRAPRSNSRVQFVARTASRTVVLGKFDCPLLEPLGSDVETTSYDAWLVHREAGRLWAKSEIPQKLATLPYQPLISVLLSISQVNIFYLERSIQSMQWQHYPNWQLCISHVCPIEGGSREFLSKTISGDPRISLTAEALDQPLRGAEGDFIALLAQNDALHSWALLEVVRRLNQKRDCELVYSDEDRIDSYGARSHPVLKFGADPEMLLGFNYIGRLAALKRAAVIKIGGFRSNFGEAQEWDLLIRLLDHVGPDALEHISHPLYHRGLPVPDLGDVSTRVVLDAIGRRGNSATVEPGIFPQSLRVKYAAPPLVKIAVFIREEHGGYQTEAIRTAVNHRDHISIYQMSDERPDFSEAALFAEVVVFINLPLETLNNCFFEELAGQALRPNVGVVTGISVNADGEVLHSGLIRNTSGSLVDPFVGEKFSESGSLDQFNVTRSVESISSDFFAVRREHLLAVDGHMPSLIERLVGYIKAERLAVIVTPLAIATFHADSRRPSLKPQNYLAAALDASEIKLRQTMALSGIWRRLTNPLRNLFGETKHSRQRQSNS